MQVLWATVTEAGEIVSTGACHGDDIDLQKVSEGLRMVPRPDYVTQFEPWRHIDGRWTKDGA